MEVMSIRLAANYTNHLSVSTKRQPGAVITPFPPVSTPMDTPTFKHEGWLAIDGIDVTQ